MSPPAVARLPCMLPSVRACTASAIIELGGGGAGGGPGVDARGSSADGSLDDTERRASASSTVMRDASRLVVADFGSFATRRARGARSRYSVRKREESAAFGGPAPPLYI